MAPTADSKSVLSPNDLKEKRNLEGISNYTKFWQKDSKDDSATDMDNRIDQYTSVVNGERPESWLYAHRCVREEGRQALTLRWQVWGAGSVLRDKQVLASVAACMRCS